MDFEWHWGSRLPTCERWQRESSCFDMTACCSTSDTQNPPKKKMKRKTVFMQLSWQRQTGVWPRKMRNMVDSLFCLRCWFFHGAMKMWILSASFPPLHNPFTIRGSVSKLSTNGCPSQLLVDKKKRMKGGLGLGGLPPNPPTCGQKEDFWKMFGKFFNFQGSFASRPASPPQVQPPSCQHSVDPQLGLSGVCLWQNCVVYGHVVAACAHHKQLHCCCKEVKCGGHTQLDLLKTGSHVIGGSCFMAGIHRVKSFPFETSVLNSWMKVTRKEISILLPLSFFSFPSRAPVHGTGWTIGQSLLIDGWPTTGMWVTDLAKYVQKMWDTRNEFLEMKRIYTWTNLND